MKQISCDHLGITLTAKSIKNGAVVIFPTDTVYGIGCNPYNESAVDRIYKIKKRDKTKQLPILGYSKQILEDIVKFDAYTNKIADKEISESSSICELIEFHILLFLEFLKP